MRQYFVLAAVGGNRPGIVAEVSELIYSCGCNLEDSRMTLLGHHFALMILLSGEGAGLQEELLDGAARLQREREISTVLFPVTTEELPVSGEVEKGNYELRVVGLDRAGIVYRTSQLLSSLKINILDLETRVNPAPESGSPVFTMRAEVSIPKEVDGKALRGDLERLADELGMEVSLARTGTWA